jgi:hypothetical protein
MLVTGAAVPLKNRVRGFGDGPVYDHEYLDEEVG